MYHFSVTQTSPPKKPTNIYMKTFFALILEKQYIVLKCWFFSPFPSLCCCCDFQDSRELGCSTCTHSCGVHWELYVWLWCLTLAGVLLGGVKLIQCSCTLWLQHVPGIALVLTSKSLGITVLAKFYTFSYALCVRLRAIVGSAYTLLALCQKSYCYGASGPSEGAAETLSWLHAIGTRDQIQAFHTGYFSTQPSPESPG